MKRQIASTRPSKNFLSQIETPCVSSYMAYAIQELVPTCLRVPIWSGTTINKGTDVFIHNILNCLPIISKTPHRSEHE